jgi:hypothetical protein
MAMMLAICRAGILHLEERQTPLETKQSDISVQSEPKTYMAVPMERMAATARLSIILHIIYLGIVRGPGWQHKLLLARIL